MRSSWCSPRNSVLEALTNRDNPRLFKGRSNSLLPFLFGITIVQHHTILINAAQEALRPTALQADREIGLPNFSFGQAWITVVPDPGSPYIYLLRIIQPPLSRPDHGKRTR
jgi:hypothetical protein